MLKNLIFILTLIFSFQAIDIYGLNYLQDNELDSLLNNYKKGQLTRSGLDSINEHLTKFSLDSIKEIRKFKEHEISIKLNQIIYDNYDWQLCSSKIIFWIVILIVFSGITFSCLNFYQSFKGITQNDVDIGISESLTGFRLKTSYVGIVIMFLSIAFFFLYLKFVYPINETPQKPEVNETVNK